MLLACILALSTYVGAYAMQYIMDFALILSGASSSALLSELTDVAVYTVQMITPVIVYFAVRGKGFADIFTIRDELDYDWEPEKISVGGVFAYFLVAFSFSSVLAIFGSIFTGIVSDVLSSFSEALVLDPQAFALPVSTGSAEFTVSIISVAVLPAILEEIFFRGVLLSEFIRYGKTFAVVASAVFFASVHGSAEQMVFSFGYGVIFGIIAVKTGSITVGILIHLLNNAYAQISQYYSVACQSQLVDDILFVMDIVLIIGGLAVIIYKICTDSLLYHERDDSCKGAGELTGKETFSAFLSPVMFIYYALVIYETYAVYFYYNLVK